MSIKDLIEVVINEGRDLLAEVPEDAAGRFIQGLDQAKRIFCAAHGRSGYVLRCFCMRLMHLGYSAFFAGETITPAIKEGDILVVCSGSGQTTLTYEWVKLAQHHGALTYGVIGEEDSPIGRALDHRVCLPGGSKKAYPKNFRSIQPPGSLFEQAAFVLLETILLGLYQRQGSNPQALFDRHSNLE
jgi:6-phospho-3-hexuloisomerase